MDKKKVVTELKDTVSAMLSDDYKERMKAEHRQLVIRLVKLSDYLNHGFGKESDGMNYDKYNKMIQQVMAMQLYLSILEERAKSENIDLSEI